MRNGWLATLLAIVLFSARPGHQNPADFGNQSNNVITGAQLGEKLEWIWIRDPGASTWRKLIPGRCPQWQLDGTRFYYFLDVGYDGSRAELWSADADGKARVRLTQSDYFIDLERGGATVGEGGWRRCEYRCDCAGSPTGAMIDSLTARAQPLQPPLRLTSARATQPRGRAGFALADATVLGRPAALPIRPRKRVPSCWGRHEGPMLSHPLTSKAGTWQPDASRQCP